MSTRSLKLVAASSVALDAEPRHTTEFLVARDPARGVPFRLGEWKISPALGTVTQTGRERRLEPRVMHVLCILASQPRQVLGREELLDEVWAGTIVNEDALTRAVSDLRKALDDDPRHPRIIATVPKRGYRLLPHPQAPALEAPTPEIPAPEIPAPGPPTAEPGPPASPVTRSAAGGHESPHSRRLLAGLCLLGTAAMIAALLITRMQHASPSPLRTAVGGRPLSSFPGSERHPAISADGRLVSFTRVGPGDSDPQIYVKTLGAEPPLRITEGGGPKSSPAWSPDGQSLAYLEECPQGRMLRTVTLLGGAPRRLTTIPPGPAGLDWSPDGRFLAYALWDAASDATRLELFEPATFTRHPIDPPPAGTEGDGQPAFSPDGRWLAFVRTSSAQLDDLYLMPSRGGEPRRLSSSQVQIHGIDWWPDSRHIVYSALPGGRAELWRLSLESEETLWLPTSSHRAVYPTVAATTGTLVYESPVVRSDIYEMPLQDHGDDPPPARVLVESTCLDSAGRVSPDGSRLAFLSNRSGHREVWIAGPDGDRPRQLTSFGGAMVLVPHWSPDGRRLAVTAKDGNAYSMFVLEISGGPVLRLTDSPDHEIVAYWSPSGAGITYEAQRGDVWRFERIDPESRRVIRDLPVEHRMLRESPDGRRVYSLYGQPCRICSRGSAGGEVIVHVDDALDLDYAHPYLPLEAGILYYRSAAGRRELVYHDLATQRRRVLVSFERDDGSHPSVTPDGSLLFDRTSFESDLVLVDAE